MVKKRSSFIKIVNQFGGLTDTELRKIQSAYRKEDVKTLRVLLNKTDPVKQSDIYVLQLGNLCNQYSDSLSYPNRSFISVLNKKYNQKFTVNQINNNLIPKKPTKQIMKKNQFTSQTQINQIQPQKFVSVAQSNYHQTFVNNPDNTDLQNLKNKINQMQHSAYIKSTYKKVRLYVMIETKEVGDKAFSTPMIEVNQDFETVFNNLLTKYKVGNVITDTNQYYEYNCLTPVDDLLGNTYTKLKIIKVKSIWINYYS